MSKVTYRMSVRHESDLLSFCRMNSSIAIIHGRNVLHYYDIGQVSEEKAQSTLRLFVVPVLEYPIHSVNSSKMKFPNHKFSVVLGNLPKVASSYMKYGVSGSKVQS